MTRKVKFFTFKTNFYRQVWKKMHWGNSLAVQWLNGHESEQTLGDEEWRESDMTQQLNNNNQQLWALIAEVPGWMPGQGAKISQLHSTTKKKKERKKRKMYWCPQWVNVSPLGCIAHIFCIAWVFFTIWLSEMKSFRGQGIWKSYYQSFLH